ncbi:zinc finger protein ZPR1-like [Oppia nitens]|uniref:zinc finger protein ZPR1-like n=1 Tax=Oppia nitens TaxID=1686743 RepID=UPI0023DC22D4|nr:zinc finger protein ZPR1-like [Oppia nitens]
MTDKVFDSLTELCDSDDQQLVRQLESLCMNCGDNGVTRMLLTEIPFFRQVVVISFECPHCHYSNNELQPVQDIGDRGIRFEIKCHTSQDLMRRIVKTEWAEIQIPEVEFEVKKQTGLITTIEGIIERAIDGLTLNIQQTNDDDSSRQKLCDFVVQLNQLKDGTKPFTFIMNDISGNSFIESFCSPELDPQVSSNRFIRGIEEDKILGIYSADNDVKDEPNNELKNEVLQFATNCPNCSVPVFTNMKVQQIPHFKEVIIMATNCDSCGHKTSEVKSGAGIGEKGIRITLKVKDENDLKKEVVISDTCAIEIPELDVKLSMTGSGKYTTVEGIAQSMENDLKKSNPFITGDSHIESIKKKIELFCQKLSNLLEKTIILDDPCGNSFITNADDVVTYERTFEQNEELGLNDIKTENYI